MNYEIQVSPEWKFHVKGNSGEEHSMFGNRQLMMRGAWIMSILKFVFPYGVIFGALVYLQLNETFDEVISYCIYAAEAFLICYLIYALFRDFRKKVVFYESGMMIKSSRKQIDIPYSELSSISIEKSSYRNAVSVQHWLNAVIPITVISVSTKEGLSVSLTSEDFIDAERKIKIFIKKADKDNI